ncbi:hypothetical protein NE237_008617 [Protea cynaroides]|uniref:K Homology domain-containing protein n=1 Tax=Protea cynaroides TaxID=273540 RepID=A0A9Q0KW78_9MAGN|nr:hypothetical protein NE237_008617 [Protea cynaroides]
MATKVDQAPVTTTSATATSSSKVSMFSAKSGFVIPKNKLSGSLVPAFRSSRKSEASDVTKEESSKQIQRKTKWGNDLTQDAAVRKGRALAYQTRVEQITQQLKSGVLKTGETQASQSPSQDPNSESSSHQINDEKQELLELERREAIGEILKLNPSYKAPSDYKPLLKEDVVPIPLKAYPGFNFIGLLLGSGRSTLKRLEEETGAKVSVHGTKAGTGEKAEITQADGDEVQNAYEELYVRVSADTYEKVDAAVALIELLVKPVAVSSAVVSTAPTSVSGATVNSVEQSQDLVTGYMMSAAVRNQGLVQPMLGSSQSGPPQVQFQPYPNPWFPLGPTQTSIQSPSGFISFPNSSLPIPNNLVQIPPPPFNPSNHPQFFARFTPVSGFGSVSGNPSLATRPQPSMPLFQRPYMHDAQPPSHISPINNPMPVSRPQSAYPSASTQPNLTVPPTFTGNQPTPTGPVPVARQLVPSVPQPLSSGPLPNRPLTPVGSSGGWSGVPAVTQAPQGIRNMVQMTSPMVPPQRPHSMVQPIASVNISATVMSRPAAPNVVFPASFPSRPPTPQLFNISAVNRPAPTPGFVSVPAQVGSSPVSLPSSQPSVSIPIISQASGLLPVPPMAGQRQPQISPAVLPRSPAPIFAQAIGTIPASAAASIQSTSTVPPMQPLNIRAPVPNQLQNPVLGSSPVRSSVPSTSPQPRTGMPIVSGSLPSFTPIKPTLTSPGTVPPVTAPKPQRPSSGDFTFQPLRHQHPASQTVPRPSGQPPAQNTPAVQPPLAPQPPSFRPALHSTPQPGIQSFARSQVANPIGQPHARALAPSLGGVVPFGVNPTTTSPPPRPPVFRSPHPVRTSTPVPHQMGPPSFGSASPHMPPIPSALPPRPANSLPLQPNQLPQTTRPGNLLFPNQQFNNSLSFTSGKPASSPGGNQIYDPFSPTSVSSAPPQQGDSPAKVRKQENDPEYEDLMDSVGVR